MRFWVAEAIGGEPAAPDEVRDLIGLLSTSLSGKNVRVLKVGRGDPEEDEPWLYLLFELAPGVTLPWSYMMFPTRHCGRLDLGEVVQLAMETVEACLIDVGRLADLLHDARRRARRVIGAWQSEGLPSGLIDVRLAPHEHWRANPEPTFEIKLHKLDNRLESAPDIIGLVAFDEIELELAEWRPRLEALVSRRVELAGLGATAWIDQFAINALAQFGDPSIGLRRFATEWGFWLPDDTCLVMIDGRVTAGRGGPAATVDFSRGWFDIRSHDLPDTVLRAAIGHPVTELVEHRYFSSDMIVLEATRGADDKGRPYIGFSLDVPQFLFCWISGRHWRAPQA